MRHRSEGEEDVEELLAVAGALDVGDLAAAAVGDAGFGEAVVADGVVAADVLGAEDTADLQLAEFAVDADLLAGGDGEVAVGEDLGDDTGEAEGDGLVAFDGAAPG